MEALRDLMVWLTLLVGVGYLFSIIAGRFRQREREPRRRVNLFYERMEAQKKRDLSSKEEVRLQENVGPRLVQNVSRLQEVQGKGSREVKGPRLVRDSKSLGSFSVETNEAIIFEDSEEDIDDIDDEDSQVLIGNGDDDTFLVFVELEEEEEFMERVSSSGFTEGEDEPTPA